MHAPTNGLFLPTKCLKTIQCSSCWNKTWHRLAAVRLFNHTAAQVSNEVRHQMWSHPARLELARLKLLPWSASPWSLLLDNGWPLLVDTIEADQCRCHHIPVCNALVLLNEAKFAVHGCLRPAAFSPCSCQNRAAWMWCDGDPLCADRAQQAFAVFVDAKPA